MSEPVPKSGHYRWMIVVLIFFATTVNYVDRQVIGILAPVLEKEIGWNEIQYGNIVAAFQLAYALGLVVAGPIIDKVGTKIGYLICLTGWSFAGMGHALASNVAGFAVARYFLGLFEAGNFPAALKTVAEWFPKKERAFATGIFNAGTNVGAVLAPLAVPWITMTWGWREAFIATGAIGMIWLFFWWLLYETPERHKNVSKEELAYIQSDPPDPAEPVPWLRLMRYRGAWAYAIGKFITDPVWWFLLFWIPKFLYDRYGITLDRIGLPLVIIYLMADIGSIGGGWLSSFFIRRGWGVNKGRKTAMLICAVAVLPIVLAPQAKEMWMAVALLGLATASHQGWSANLFTTPSDMFPRKTVGSVVGFGGMAGAIGGFFIATLAGFVLQVTGSYVLLFIICGSAYLVALAVIHILVPELKPIEMGHPESLN
jgi:ACS family hexuronate transporter-like MFS transporter